MQRDARSSAICAYAFLVLSRGPLRTRAKAQSSKDLDQYSIEATILNDAAAIGLMLSVLVAARRSLPQPPSRPA